MFGERRGNITKMRAHTSFEARSPHLYRSLSRSSSQMEHVNYIPLGGGGRHIRVAGTQTDDDFDFLPSLPRERGTNMLAQSWDDKGYANHSFDPHMDNLNVGQSYDSGLQQAAFNNYYQRMRQGGNSFAHKRRPRATDQGPPIFRYGRLGAPWRHIKQCTGNLGNHICFIDGTVKQDDARHCPPYGLVPEGHTYISPRIRSAPQKKLVGPRQTISGRMMKLGVGF